MNVLHENRPVQRISRGGRRLEHDAMADESLVSIVQGGRTLTRLLASRNDLKALTIGHMALEHGCTLDENSLSVNPQSDGSVHIVIDDGIEIPATVARPDIVTSSCGACHHPSLTERVRLGHYPIGQQAKKDTFRTLKTRYLHADKQQRVLEHQ